MNSWTKEEQEMLRSLVLNGRAEFMSSQPYYGEHSCLVCRKLEHSYKERPVIPPGGNMDDLLYVCKCGNRWWQFNQYFHLWKHVTEPEEWHALREWPMANMVCDQTICNEVVDFLWKDEE